MGYEKKFQRQLHATTAIHLLPHWTGTTHGNDAGSSECESSTTHNHPVMQNARSEGFVYAGGIETLTIILTNTSSVLSITAC